MSEQYHFEFNQWEEAFKMFYRKRCGEKLIGDDGSALGFRKGNPEIVLVISTASYTSGYWIEEGAEDDDVTRVYRSVAAVKALERRIRTKRLSTVNLSIGLVV